MSDPREVPPRCHARLSSVDLLARRDHVCTFRAGHTGMHSGRPLDQRGEFTDGDPIRWGTPSELAAEVALMAPKNNKEDRSVKSDPE